MSSRYRVSDDVDKKKAGGFFDFPTEKKWKI